MTNREDEILANIGQTIDHQEISDFGRDNNIIITQNNENNFDAVVSESWPENPPSSASSGFSDDDSLAGAEGDPKTIEQIVQMVKALGRQGLIREYSDIRNRPPDGTFTHARYNNNL